MEGTCSRCGCKTPLSRKYCKECAELEWGPSGYAMYIRNWLSGKIHPRTRNGQIPSPIRRYLLALCDNVCPECGWDKINPSTGRVPLTIDHRDGNADNNSPDNVRVLCPNCHSLTANYGRLNKNSSRTGRQKYRKMKKLDAIAAGYPPRYIDSATEEIRTLVTRLAT